MTATYGVVGPNASGKTRLLTELHASHPDFAFAPSAHHARFAGRTVADHLACARLARPDFDDALAARFLDEIDDSTPIARLSTGHARLVTLAAACASGRSGLLLDEPFDGLDVGHRQRVREILIELLGTSVEKLYIASHRAEDLVGLVDQLITVTSETAGPAALDDLRYRYPTVSGSKEEIAALSESFAVLSTSALGGRAFATVFDPAGTLAAQASYPDDAALIDLLAVHGITD